MTKMNEENRDATGRAYQIVWSLLAPGLVGDTDVSDQKKCVACSLVRKHWQQYAELPMPADVREVVDSWADRYEEFFPA